MLRELVADQVTVHFDDGSSTVIYVLEDDDIKDEIVEMCEIAGFDPLSVSDYSIDGQVTEEI